LGRTGFFDASLPASSETFLPLEKSPESPTSPIFLLQFDNEGLLVVWQIREVHFFSLSGLSPHPSSYCFFPFSTRLDGVSPTLVFMHILLLAAALSFFLCDDPVEKPLTQNKSPYYMALSCPAGRFTYFHRRAAVGQSDLFFSLQPQVPSFLYLRFFFIFCKPFFPLRCFFQVFCGRLSASSESLFFPFIILNIRCYVSPFRSFSAFLAGLFSFLTEKRLCDVLGLARFPNRWASDDWVFSFLRNPPPSSSRLSPSFPL